MNDERNNSVPLAHNEPEYAVEPISNDHFAKSGGDGREARISVITKNPQPKTEPAGQ